MIIRKLALFAHTNSPVMQCYLAISYALTAWCLHLVVLTKSRYSCVEIGNHQGYTTNLVPCVGVPVPVIVKAK